MITTLKVQNYKSLKDVEIPLKPLTVLIGPNGAGKSNILDCLVFLSQIAVSGSLSNTVGKRGSFRDIVWGGKMGETISLEVSWLASGPEQTASLYGLVCKDQPGEGPVILKEMVQASDERIRREGSTIRHAQGSTSGVGSSNSMLLLGSWPILTSVRQTLAGWSFYDLLPNAMRQLQGVAKQTRLRPDGSNVATLLHWIFSEERAVFADVQENLKAAIPEVEELLSPLTEDGKTYVAWKEKGIPGRIPAWNMSEGSVRLVAMLLALLVPEPPSLVAFENPDIHLHVHQMQYLAEILKAASRRSQIIITTHSPYLLDHMPPESVLVVWKENGETKVKPVKDSAELREALKTLGLGEIYYAGHLGGVP